MFTAHDVRKFKPAPGTYQSVAESLGVERASMCMVAAPDIVEADLVLVADEIIRRWS
jgi:FMN phosphatase YigB (HAD superfamily)